MAQLQARWLKVEDLGLVGYEEALAAQRQLRDRRIVGSEPDTLFLVEHPPTYTIGRRSDGSEFRVSRVTLEAQGFPVVEVERGGRTTYHGPGQLVGYPVVNLRDFGLSVPAYIDLLEGCLIRCLGGMGLTAERRVGYPGVWVNGRKIGAIGVHLKRWVTIHGFALNVSPNLEHFSAIVPCGIPSAEVTSVQHELQEIPPMAMVKRRIVRELATGLGCVAMDCPRDVPVETEAV